MPPKSRAHFVLLIVILTLGVALRFSQPTLVEFKRDEATVARLGQAIAFERYLPAVGVDSSLGIDNLPLTLYLVALPLRLWSDPLSAVLFTMLLNSLALPACYLLAKAALGKRAALLSTLLFAVSPWAVLYARKIWSRTLPIFTLALMASLFLTFVRRRRWALVAAFASLAMMVGLQLEALAFVPILLVALVLFRDAVAWRPLLIGVLVALCLVSPYIVHDAANGWENARGLITYARGGGTFSWDALRYTFALLGSQGIDGQAGPFHLQFAAGVPPFWWLNTALSVLLVAALGYGLYQMVRGSTRERRRTFVLLLLWFAVPIVLQLKPSAPTQQHYFVMHYPVQFMLIAAFVVGAIEWVARRVGEGAGRRMVRYVMPALVLLLGLGCGWQVLVTGKLRAMMVAHPTTGGYGTPLRYTRQAAHEAVRLAQGGEVIVLSEETRPFVTETPTVFDALLFGTPHRFADPRAAVPFPEDDRFAYLVGPVSPDTEEDVGLVRLTQLASISSGPSVVLRDGVSYSTFLGTGESRHEALGAMTSLGPGVPFANNVVFAAYEAVPSVEVGAPLEVWLAWWLRDVPPEAADYHFTAQVLSDDGALQGQDDHAGFPSAGWAAGDLVLSHFTVILPDRPGPGSYRLRVGMYSYPEIRAVPVVNAQGEPVDDGVTLEEIEIGPISEIGPIYRLPVSSAGLRTWVMAHP